MSDNENANQEQPVGDDGLNDEQRRLAKQKLRDEEQAEIDKAGDRVRAEQERANGEPEGARGRNAESTGSTGMASKESDDDAKSVGSTGKATPRKAQSGASTGR